MLNPAMRLKWISSLFFCILAVVLFGAAGTWAAGSRPDTGKLTARLAALSTSGVRAMSRSDQAKVLSLPASGPGSLLRHGQYLVVDVRVRDTSASTLSAISGAGARIVHVSNGYRMVAVEIRPEALKALAGLDEVEAVMEEFAPAHSGSLDGLSAQGGALAPSCENPGGSVVSEGDIQLRADLARTIYGVDGSGLSVGILSDSFDKASYAPTHAADDVLSGDLPGAGNPCGYTTPVDVLEEDASPYGGTDEGRAMAQIVHDLAPGAKLLFASADNGLYGYADNIGNLFARGAQILVDDVFYFNEPFFQDGPVSVAINKATDSGALYYTAAGNESVYLDGRNIASWEAPAYRPTACPSAVSDSDCMDFDPGPGVDNSFDITSGSGFLLVLQWSEPWNGVKTDLDLHVIQNGVEVSSSTENNFITGQPFEVVMVPPGPAGIVISRNSGTKRPRLKFVLFDASDISAFEYRSSRGGDIVGPTILGHSDCAAAVSVAAVPYNDGSQAESYSSMGPAVHYWKPVSGTIPASALLKPQILNKPDIAATDGGASTFFGMQDDSGVHRFYGTSAAAPHAAAVAALMLDAAPGTTASQVKAAMKTTARPVGTEPSSRVGGGLVDADAAVQGILAIPVPVVGSFTIVKGAASTASRRVILKNTWRGARPSKYMASEDSGFSGARWLAYSPAPVFNLSSGFGTKTVYLKLKSGSGAESETAQASISLVEPEPVIVSFRIDNGAASTNRPAVALNYAVTGSTPVQYVASESKDFSGAVWQTYSAAASFTLSSGHGPKTVYFKVRAASGLESKVVHDGILLK